MAAVPAWKLAIQERKKIQEDEQKTRLAKEEEVKLASLPAWKRAIILRERQTKALNSSNSSTSIPAASPSSSKWQAAVKRVKGPDSPILKKIAWGRDTNASNHSSQGQNSVQTIQSKNVLSRWKPAHDFLASTPVVATADTHPVKSTVMSNSVPAKLVATSSTITPPAAAQSVATSKFVATRKSVATSKSVATRTVAHTAATTPAKSESHTSIGTTQPSLSASKNGTLEDPSLAGLPAWKKALIIRKRKVQQQDESDDAGLDETDSAPFIQKDPSPPQTKKKEPQVVNRNDGEQDNQKLIEQEGKTLHPPIYKEVNQWENVDEEDEKFKKLPLWKQALIRRRRADRALRSGQTIPPPSPQVQSNKKDMPKKTKEVNKKSPAETPPTSIEKTSRKVKNDGKSRLVHSRANKSSAEKARKQATPPKKINTEKKVKTTSIKPVRKAPSLPTTVKKEQSIFSYNFSKSSLNTGSSSDSTDSDLEDAVVTNLDDLSGESDSGIVLQSYRPSEREEEEEEEGLNDIGSILSTPGRKKALGRKKAHLRRVSWSDSNLVLEHVYPKYDYSDYDDLQGDGVIAENGGFSHRLHPSLRSPTDPYFTGYSPSGSLASFVPSSFSPSLMSNHYNDFSSSPQPDPSQLQEDFVTDSVQDDDEQMSNAAALLW